MLILRGTLRAATQLGGQTNRKTGEIVPLRDVLQVDDGQPWLGSSDHDHRS